MSSLREKLLSVIDPEKLLVLSDEQLLDILLAQFAAMESDLVAARTALIKEVTRADEAIRNARQQLLSKSEMKK